MRNGVSRDLQAVSVRLVFNAVEKATRTPSIGVEAPVAFHDEGFVVLGLHVKLHLMEEFLDILPFDVLGSECHGWMKNRPWDIFECEGGAAGVFSFVEGIAKHLAAL